MAQNIYSSIGHSAYRRKVYLSPPYNIYCDYHFTCGAKKCPRVVAKMKMPSCHVDKFKRYQPDNGNGWYDRTWNDVTRISWVEVLSLKEAWIYFLLIAVIAAFADMLMLMVRNIFYL